MLFICLFDFLFVCFFVCLRVKFLLKIEIVVICLFVCLFVENKTRQTLIIIIKPCVVLCWWTDGGEIIRFIILRVDLNPLKKKATSF